MDLGVSSEGMAWDDDGHELVAAVADRSRGNPLHILELLKLLKERDVVQVIEVDADDGHGADAAASAVLLLLRRRRRLPTRATARPMAAAPAAAAAAAQGRAMARRRRAAAGPMERWRRRCAW